MKDDTYIVLYADEFKIDVWIRYEVIYALLLNKYEETNNLP